MRHVLIALGVLIAMCLLPYRALSDTGSSQDTWASYESQDVFQWTNYDNDVHLLAAYSIALTGGLILEHTFGMERLPAAMTSTFVSAMIGITKEVMFDRYTSRTDIKCWAAGALAGGLTMTILRF